jgi:hypothetical protein
VITRQWTATDECGNQTNRVQLIAVRDTTPPVLIVGTNRTIVAGTPLVFDPATATDACGTATVTVLGTQTNNLAFPIYRVTRIWWAADECGNATTNSQTIAVVAGLPQVSLVSVQSGVLTLRWPAYATDYRLEASLDLKKWSPPGLAHRFSNGWWYVGVQISGPRQYFRLVNTPPTLVTRRTAPGTLTLIWPTAPAGFTLEASDNLRPPNWTPLAVTPAVTNMLNYVDVNLAGARKFYRLTKPLP